MHADEIQEMVAYLKNQVVAASLEQIKVYAVKLDAAVEAWLAR